MSDPTTAAPTWLELERVLPLAEVEKLTNLSPDTLKRRYPEIVVQLSPRRVGMKLKHALAITGRTREIAETAA
jgi:hypothetical protein